MTGVASAIERVGVVGGGLMGSGIAEVCARRGFDVIVKEVNEPAVAAARKRLESSLRRAVKAAKLEEEQRQETLSRVRFTTDFGDLADRQIVIEAVIESETEKLEVFSMLDKTIADETALFATNTSSIPIMKLAMGTSRPQAVVGLHFFNPAPVMELVELIPSLLTSEDTANRTEHFITVGLGKRLVRSKDRAGFVVNALLVPYLLSAVRMLESGFATAEDIDAGIVLGCHHPMGPLALLDLVGLDTAMFVANSLYDEFKEPLYAPPPLLCRMVEAGLLGRKSGRGFYDYR